MGNVHQAGRLLLTLGLAATVAGLLLMYSDRAADILGRLGKLPGDIVIERGNFRFYLPITTCIIISAVLWFIFRAVGRK